ncbi:hypothetical protein HYH03_009743 [Edaphochlamys debaryana]|uniref:Ion transport domain-containing protein n=1 Tax=Edaphochlamys debaryana TaxID=47281 RepID=A0A835XYA7_9CHLO|nr:hypothetical protein HYH03_009743 [Edaphochlamys debaryana]|eukprot:KAG2492014.1 hypothetical protein HYH03_009743 [Edaphochlamys debaryana]
MSGSEGPHGPEHLPHLHTAFEDPEAQQAGYSLPPTEAVTPSHRDGDGDNGHAHGHRHDHHRHTEGSAAGLGVPHLAGALLPDPLAGGSGSGGGADSAGGAGGGGAHPRHRRPHRQHSHPLTAAATAPPSAPRARGASPAPHRHRSIPISVPRTHRALGQPHVHHPRRHHHHHTEADGEEEEEEDDGIDDDAYSLSVSLSPSASPSARPSSHPSLSITPGSHAGTPGRHRRVPRRGSGLGGSGALDGAVLAAACAAAPLNPTRSHRSHRTRSSYSQPLGLRRNSSANAMNIHPDILDELRALDDLEGGSLLRPLLTVPPLPEEGCDGEGGGGEGGEGEGGGGGEGEDVGHVDEAETYEVQELLEAKPKDVLQFIEEEGVVKLSEFEVADGLALRAFGSEPFLVMGHEHAEPPDLKELWTERLGERGKMQGTGWTSTLSVEAHVVNLYDAAAPGASGLLRPLVARLRVRGCPPTVFALPAVQAIIALKWSSWARHFLMAEFFFYAAWLAAFSAFTLLLEDGDDPSDPKPPPPDELFAAPPASLLFPASSPSAISGFSPSPSPVAAGLSSSVPVIRTLAAVARAAAAALHPIPAAGSGSSSIHGSGSGSGSDGTTFWVGDDAYDMGCPARYLNLWDWSALGRMVSSPRGVGQLLTSCVAFASMLPFAYMEVCTMAVQGLAWVTLWNLADVVSYLITAGIWLTHLRCGSLPASAYFSGALALQHVLLWTKLHYYARVLTPTRGGFNDTIRMVLGELRTFLTFVGLVMLGFAFAFYCLFRQDRDDFADFATLWHSFASMFAYMLQMFDYNVLYGSTHPVMAMILFMAYELMVAVLLLNIMIALMTSAFARVNSDEGLRYLIYKAEVIDELESTLPRWLMRADWAPHFVHVLKVSPRSTYEINLNSVWSGMSTLQSSVITAQQETRMRVEALEEKLDVIDQKLSATVRLLASRLLTHRELATALSMDDVAEADSAASGEQDLLDEEGSEPDPETWRDAALDAELGGDQQDVPEADEGEDLTGGIGGVGAARIDAGFRLVSAPSLDRGMGGGGAGGARGQRAQSSRQGGGGGSSFKGEPGPGAGPGRGPAGPGPAAGPAPLRSRSPYPGRGGGAGSHHLNHQPSARHHGTGGHGHGYTDRHASAHHSRRVSHAASAAVPSSHRPSHAPSLSRDHHHGHTHGHGHHAHGHHGSGQASGQQTGQHSASVSVSVSREPSSLRQGGLGSPARSPARRSNPPTPPHLQPHGQPSAPIPGGGGTGGRYNMFHSMGHGQESRRAHGHSGGGAGEERAERRGGRASLDLGAVDGLAAPPTMADRRGSLDGGCGGSGRRSGETGVSTSAGAAAGGGSANGGGGGPDGAVVVDMRWAEEGSPPSGVRIGRRPYGSGGGGGSGGGAGGGGYEGITNTGSGSGAPPMAPIAENESPSVSGSGVYRGDGGGFGSTASFAGTYGATDGSREGSGHSYKGGADGA